MSIEDLEKYLMEPAPFEKELEGAAKEIGEYLGVLTQYIAIGKGLQEANKTIKDPRSHNPIELLRFYQMYKEFKSGLEDLTSKIGEGYTITINGKKYPLTKDVMVLLNYRQDRFLQSIKGLSMIYKEELRELPLLINELLSI